MDSSTKTRINCADYTIPLSALDCAFDRFMQIFYDNGIKCMGIVHNRPKQGVAHCHIVTVPYLPQAEFKKITGKTYFFRRLYENDYSRRRGVPFTLYGLL